MLWTLKSFCRVAMPEHLQLKTVIKLSIYLLENMT